MSDTLCILKLVNAERWLEDKAEYAQQLALPRGWYDAKCDPAILEAVDSFSKPANGELLCLTFYALNY